MEDGGNGESENDCKIDKQQIEKERGVNDVIQPANSSEKTFQQHSLEYLGRNGFMSSSEYYQFQKEMAESLKNFPNLSLFADKKDSQSENINRRKHVPSNQKLTSVCKETQEMVTKCADVSSGLPCKSHVSLMQQNPDDFPIIGASCSKVKRGDIGPSNFRENNSFNDLCVCHSAATVQNFGKATGISHDDETGKTVASKRNTVKIDHKKLAKVTTTKFESRCSERNSNEAIKTTAESDCENKLQIKKGHKVFRNTDHCTSPSDDCHDKMLKEIFQVSEIPTLNLKDISNEIPKKVYKKKGIDKKKRKKEEEYRRKLLPKDQKVILVDRKFLDNILRKISDVPSGLPSKTHHSSLEQNPDDFPALGAACSKPKRDMGPSICKASMHPSDSTEQNSNSATGTSTTGESNKMITTKTSYWKNPLQLNLLKIAKNQAALKREDKRKQNTKVQKQSKPTFSRNPLDSSNPERKRGKFRENKKVKLSTLKKIIHNELEKKKNERVLDQRNVNIENEETNLEHEEQDFSSLFNEIFNGLFEPEGISQPCGDKNSSSDKIFEMKSKNNCSHESKTELSSIINNNGSITPVKPQSIVHSRKFRDYCDHFVTPEINGLASSLIRELLRLQDRQYQRDPLKANGKRKYVVGLHETRKFLALKKVKLLIIATDIEKIESAGGLNDIISQVKEMAIIQNVPYVFALQRRKIGYLTLKKSPVSCVCVLNYQACESQVNALLEAVTAARQQYNDAKNKCEDNVKQDDLLDAQPPTQVDDGYDGAVKELIDSFISLVRSDTPAESADNSSPFLQAIERIGKS